MRYFASRKERNRFRTFHFTSHATHPVPNIDSVGKFWVGHPGLLLLQYYVQRNYNAVVKKLNWQH
jgi:hypothetical protein